MDKTEPIEFVCTVEKVQTMAKDNTIRVWLDLPESALFQMARLVECNVRGQVLDVMAMPRESETEKDYGL